MPPGKHNQPHNPYASAAGAYGTHSQKNTNDPREVEARVLLKSAQFMVDLQREWDSRPSEALEDILKYNRNIWMMFYDTAVENTDGNRPEELRNNIYNLANFVFKRELDIISKPEAKKLDILIKINRDIANGLMTSIKNAPAPDENGAPQSNADDTQKPPSGGWNSSA